MELDVIIGIGNSLTMRTSEFLKAFSKEIS